MKNLGRKILGILIVLVILTAVLTGLGFLFNPELAITHLIIMSLTGIGMIVSAAFVIMLIFVVMIWAFD